MFMSGKSPGPESPSEFLRRRIALEGPVGFDEFMSVALYHPHGGYYAADHARTGRRGDFFTSVSVGPVFGKLLATQFASMWEKLGRPDDFTLVEQGANDGQLLADIFEALETSHPDWNPRAIIVEPLEHPRAAQRQTLARWHNRIRHVEQPAELPPFTGVFFANELLDAFPVKLLVRQNGTWLERRVGLDGDDFIFVEQPLEAGEFHETVTRLPLPTPPDRFQIEIPPDLASWMDTVASRLLRGWMLLVDYGHPEGIRCHPARATGTVAAYQRHERQENPLASPGHQDLTAHVNFTDVARAAEVAGLSLAGFTDQHHALAALAALTFPAMPQTPLSEEAAREMRALRQLLHPESMGTAFHFLAFSRGTEAPLEAFQFARHPRQELFS
jgi:SAM-dependent MidA family methyltransferase